MKVLHLNSADYGGAATSMIRQHLALMDIGIESKALTNLSNGLRNKAVYSYNLPQEKSLLLRCLNRINLLRSEFDREKLIIERLGSPYHQGGSFELFSSPYSNFRLDQHPLVKEADIINIHWIGGFLDIPSFFRNIQKPVVWTLHDMNPYSGGFHYDIDEQNNTQLQLLNEKYYKIKKKALVGVKYSIVGNSKWNTTNAIQSMMFSNALSIETIYTPLNPKQFRPIDKIVAKNALNLPADKFVIGFVSESLSNPRKGFAKLLEAISALPANYKNNLQCLTLGHNSHNSGKLSEIPFTDIGSLNNSDLQSIVYSAMDVFVIPSLAEAFGLTALEAMACKTPVIGYDVGGIPEMIKSCFTGLLASEKSISSLTKRICEMMDLSSAKRETLATNAYTLVETQHSPNEIACQYKKVYQNLINA